MKADPNAFICVVPSDVNARPSPCRLSVMILIIVLDQGQGFGGYMHELFSAVGPKVVINFIFQPIELTAADVSWPCGLSAGRTAANRFSIPDRLLPWYAVAAGRSVGHLPILVITLQAFVFMMLTIVYLSLAVEDH